LDKNQFNDARWKNDAEGGKLSYSQMVYKWNKRHFTVENLDYDEA